VLRSAALLEAQGRPVCQVLLINCAQRALDDKRLTEQPLRTPEEQQGRVVQVPSSWAKARACSSSGFTSSGDSSWGQ
jgi:hypothetical protein